jgi:hypothetical protein
MKKLTKRLAVSATTLRSLTSPTLAAVVGGIVTLRDCTIATCTCSHRPCTQAC